MTTPSRPPPDAHSRFTDDPGFLIYRNGRLISAPPGVNVERVQRASNAWQLFWRTGDDSELVNLGILSKDSSFSRSYRESIEANSD